MSESMSLSKQEIHKMKWSPFIECKGLVLPVVSIDFAGRLRCLQFAESHAGWLEALYVS